MNDLSSASEADYLSGILIGHEIMASAAEASSLTEILKGPYRGALNTVRDLISGPAAKFLTARAETLEALDSLRRDYRKSILTSEQAVAPDSKDPFADVFKSKGEQLERPLGVALETLDGFLGVNPPRSEKPFAFLYGVCTVQDAKFSGEGLQDSFQTLASLGLGAVDDAKDSSIVDLTNRIVRMAASQPQLLY
jgi:hypothetical protein